MKRPYYILSLDGGGSLGVYTLGVLVEIERMIREPLHEVFNLVYGTSTGAIIASMIALGEDVENTIHDRYFDIIPDIMKRKCPSARTRALHRHANEVYGDRKFDAFSIDVGIVATHLEYRRPTVFKRRVNQAHGSTGSFVPGFGCTIADAVIASCAARPYFKKKRVSTENYDTRSIVDGGFVANNPTLFALTDALGSLGLSREEIRVLSVGTGSFPQKRSLMGRLFEVVSPTIVTLSKASSNTVETLRGLLFDDVRTLRIDDAYTEERYRCHILERRAKVLEAVFQLGRESFSKKEKDLRDFFELKGS